MIFRSSLEISQIFLPIFPIGDRIQDIERLVGALADIKRLYSKDPAKMLNTEYINPKVLVSPQVAFYSQKESMPVRQTAGRIAVNLSCAIRLEFRF